MRATELYGLYSVVLHFFSAALCGLKILLARSGQNAIPYSVDLAYQPRTCIIRPVCIYYEYGYKGYTDLGFELKARIE